jgi:hypothetical protein
MSDTVEKLIDDATDAPDYAPQLRSMAEQHLDTTGVVLALMTLQKHVSTVPAALYWLLSSHLDNLLLHFSSLLCNPSNKCREMQWQPRVRASA